jgi:tetratricopeptide (TPR) repeat protein
MSLVLLRDGHQAEARSLAERAYQLACELGDAECIFWSGFRLVSQLMTPERQEEVLRLIDELVSGPHEGVSARTLELLLRVAQGIYLGAGDRARAERCWAGLDGLASRTQDASLLTWPETREAIRAMLDGDLESALSHAAQAEAQLDELVGPSARLTLLRSQVLLALGRVDEVPVDEVSIDGETRLAVLAAVGRREEAATRLQKSFEQLPSAWQEHVSTVLLVDLLETAALLEDRSLAPAMAARLQHVVGAAPSNYALCNVARHRGAAAALVGDRYTAHAAYQEALDWAQRIRARPEVALTRLGLAELLLTGDTGEQAKAQDHLDFAIEEFRAMKMQPALERGLNHKGLLHA